MQFNSLEYVWHQNLGWYSDSRGAHLKVSQDGHEIFLELYVANSQLRVRTFALDEDQLEHVRGVWFKLIPTGDLVNLLHLDQPLQVLAHLDLEHDQEFKLQLKNALLILGISHGGIVEIKRVLFQDDHTSKFS